MLPGLEFKGHVFGEKDVSAGLFDSDFKLRRISGVVKLQDLQFTFMQKTMPLKGGSILNCHVK